MAEDSKEKPLSNCSTIKRLHLHNQRPQDDCSWWASSKERQGYNKSAKKKLLEFWTDLTKLNLSQSDKKMKEWRQKKEQLVISGTLGYLSNLLAVVFWLGHVDCQWNRFTLGHWSLITVVGSSRMNAGGSKLKYLKNSVSSKYIKNYWMLHLAAGQ